MKNSFLLAGLFALVTLNSANSAPSTSPTNATSNYNTYTGGSYYETTQPGTTQTNAAPSNTSTYNDATQTYNNPNFRSSSSAGYNINSSSYDPNVGGARATYNDPRVTRPGAGPTNR